MPTPSLDIRTYLQAELVGRCKANPRYSLRAFAQHLKIESSALSKILGGKRSVSRAMLRRLSAPLQLGPESVSAFESQIRESRGRRRNQLVSPAPSPFQQLAFDQFQVIADWYHFAILELVQLQSFRPNVRWIARSLGITTRETKAAVARLQRVGLLEIRPDGTWLDLNANLSNIGDLQTSSAHRHLQRQILALAARALDETPAPRRDQTGMTMAIDSRKLAEAKARIREFRRELCQFLQEGSNKDSVYQLSVSLFPLSKGSL